MFKIVTRLRPVPATGFELHYDERGWRSPIHTREQWRAILERALAQAKLRKDGPLSNLLRKHTDN